MVKISDNSVLVVIDVQNAWLDPTMGNRNNPSAESLVSDLIKRFRDGKKAVIHVRHSSLNPNSSFREGKSTYSFQDKVMPKQGELIITNLNSRLLPPL